MPSPAEIAALRALVSRQARLHFVELFEKTIKEVLEKRKFLSGECISEEIAKECAKSLNVKGGVEMKDLHHHWREAEFTHTAYAPMPDPPKKRMPKGPDVLVRTIFSVAKKSGFLEFAYREVGDDGSFKVRVWFWHRCVVPVSMIRKTTADPLQNFFDSLFKEFNEV